MPNWFYKKDERIIGPVSKQELDFLATEGRIKGSTPIRFGDRGEWKRYRPAKASSPVAATTSAVNPQPSIDVPDVPFEADEKVSSGPPALTTDSDRTRRQAAVGGILALLVLLLLWFFWTQYSGSSLRGSRNVAGVGVAQNAVVQGDGAGESDSSQQAKASVGQTNDATSMVADAGEDQSQSGQPLDNSGDGSVTTESAGQSAQDNAQSTASVDSANDKKQDDDLATETMDGQDSIQAGDPMSKFTISAPGEAVFFGLRATGNRFAFVVDRSGSMDGVRMQRAREELMNCIHAMPKHVEVFVVFFNDIAHPDKAAYRKMDSSNLAELQQWVNSNSAGGGTEVSAGMKEVFSRSDLPDSIFLLTDGDFNPSTPQFVKQLNSAGTVRINTVALVSQAGERLLKQIAKENDGDYKYVP